MKKLIRELTIFIRFLSAMKARLERNVIPRNVTLKSSHNSKRDRFYLNEGGKLRYLKKDEVGIAQILSQQEYNAILIDKLNVIIESASNLSGLLAEPPWESALKLLAPAKRPLVKVPIDGEEAVESWRSQHKRFNEIDPEHRICPSLRGALFRSKSEASIADLFDYYHIEYLYECELVLSNGKRCYPDFTLFFPQTGAEIIWEHFGMMEKSGYAENAITKINDYAADGFIMGVNFFCTFESLGSPLNKNTVLKIIKSIIEENL